VKKSPTTLLAVVLVLGLCPSVMTATLSVPDGYGTIREAIDAAQDGDTVLVSPGIYTGAGNTGLTVAGKRLFIKGEQGAKVTVIDGLGTAFAGFGAPYGEIAVGTVIDGFTVTNARHGLFVSSDSAVVRSCRFVDNLVAGISADYYRNPRCSVSACNISSNPVGFGPYYYDRAPSEAATGEDYRHHFVFDGCIFDSNTVAVETFAELHSCTLTGNLTVFRLSVHPLVHVYDSEISGNYGAIALLTGEQGDDVDRGSLFLYNCLIFDNRGGISRGSSLDRPFGRLKMTGCLYHHNQGKIDIGPLPYAAVFARNTFVDNTDFALRFSPPRREILHEVWDNIVAFNQGCGITFDLTEPGLSLSCNDLFANESGNYCGQLGDSTGFRGNISVDPLFENREGSNYSLLTESPCLASPAPCEENKGWPGGGGSTQMPTADTIPPAAINDLH